MFDTHCHLTFPKLYQRVDEVIGAARQAGVDKMISVGVTPKEAQRAVKLAEKYNGVVYATAGVHPLYVDDFHDKEALLDDLRQLASNKKIVALGEMGLDNSDHAPDLAHQKKVLKWQLQLAGEFENLAIIIHSRLAIEQTIKILAESQLKPQRFVFHCFSGSDGDLKAILNFGAMVSLTGIVTFKNAADVAKASDQIPIERLMIETDSPYLTPAPFRKIKPNEPKYVTKVAEFLAQRRNMEMEKFIEQMDTNAKKFFGI